jgi:hypothetical protein
MVACNLSKLSLLLLQGLRVLFGAGTNAVESLHELVVERLIGLFGLVG